MTWAHKIPVGLTLLRAALGPVLLAFAFFAPMPGVLVGCLCVAFVSDVFDGVIARRLGVATQGVRRLDSLADTVFYCCAVLAAYRLHPAAIASHFASLVVLVALELLRYAFDFAKFGREASYHMWSSKVWGVFLFLGFVTLLGFAADGWLVCAAILMGIVADIEGLMISALLPAWTHDVPTVVHAWRLRRELGRGVGTR